MADKTEKSEKLKAFESSVRHRVQCEEKAFHVINRLIEDAVEGSFLEECGLLLSKEDYESVVEERAITRLCGYPVCGNNLKNIPNKQYHICTRTNQVYDISERKNFCSSKCFQASKDFHNQIPDSPVWMRERTQQESITLLSLDHARGLRGEQVIGELPTKSLEAEVEALKKLEKNSSSDGNRQNRIQNPKHPENSGKFPKVSLSESKESKSLGKESGVNTDKSNQDSDMAFDAHMLVNRRESEGSTIERLEKIHIGCDDLTKATDSENSEVCGESTSRSKTNMGFDETGNSREEGTQEGFQILSDNLERVSLVEDQSEQRVNAKSGIFRNSADSSDQSSSSQTCNNNSASATQSSDSKMDRLLKLMSQKKGKLSVMVDIQEQTHKPVISDGASESKSDVPHDKLVKKTDSDSQSSSNCEEKNIDSGISTQKTNASAKQKISKSKSKLSKEDEAHKLSILQQIAKILKSWITESTIKYLHSPTSSNPGESRVGKFSDPAIQRDYVALCQRVNQKEAEMDSLLQESAGLGCTEAGSGDRPRQGIPVYDVLRQEAEDFELKVSEFITGKPRTDKKKEKEEDGEIPVFFPTVDKYDQAQIRAKIVLDRLDKSLSELLQPLKLTLQDVVTGMRDLVHTFQLERDNIIFRPSEWTLVAIFVLKMLGTRDKKIASAFSSESSSRFFSILFKGIRHSMSDVDVLVEKLLNNDSHCEGNSLD